MSGIYHPGEKEVQERAGVRTMAERIGKSIHSTIPMAAQEFLRRQSFAALGSIDLHGRLWASIITGAPGFLQSLSEREIRIDAPLVTGDPLEKNLEHPAPLGMLAIDFARRQRMRANGNAEIRSDGAIHLSVREVFSNCPKYIQSREPDQLRTKRATSDSPLESGLLSAEQQRIIKNADTFFIASSHQEAGADVSHRGGNPGFVHVLNAGKLVWPDYSGNMMFQTLGNIASNPRAGLIFLDFQKRTTVQITGRATIQWDVPRPEDFPGAQRLLEFEVQKVVEIPNALPTGWWFLDYSPHNP